MLLHREHFMILEEFSTCEKSTRHQQQQMTVWPGFPWLSMEHVCSRSAAISRWRSS